MSSKIESINDAFVHFLYEHEDWTQKEIANYYGVCQTTICFRLHPEKQKEHNDSRKDYHKKYQKEWQQFGKGKDYISEYMKEYRQSGKGREYLREWRQTNKGKAWCKRVHASRRNLGSVELNKSFIDSEGHHIDTEHIINVPKELHRSTKHNVFTGQGMKEINTIAFQYIIEGIFDKLIVGEI